MYTVAELRDYDRSDTDAMLDWAADEIERLRAIVHTADKAMADIDSGSPDVRQIAWHYLRQREEAGREP